MATLTIEVRLPQVTLGEGSWTWGEFNVQDELVLTMNPNETLNQFNQRVGEAVIERIAHVIGVDAPTSQ